MITVTFELEKKEHYDGCYQLFITVPTTTGQANKNLRDILKDYDWIGDDSVADIEATADWFMYRTDLSLFKDLHKLMTNEVARFNKDGYKVAVNIDEHINTAWKETFREQRDLLPRELDKYLKQGE